MTTEKTLPEFYSDRLHFRIGVLEDLDELDAFFSSDASRYVGGPRPRGETWDALCAGVGHWHLRGFGLWIITSLEDGKMVGVAGLQQPEGWPEPELIWVIFSQYSGGGYATEAVQAIRPFIAREYGVTQPMSLIYPEYRAVVRMAEKLGARRIEDVEIPDGPVPAWRFPAPTGEPDA